MMNTINAISARIAAATPLSSLQPPAVNKKLSGSADQEKNTTISSEFANELNQTAAPDPNAVRDAFDDFVGQTFYSEMLSSLRKTTSKPAYLHGGRGEEVFRGQLDQMLAKEMTEATKGQFTGPMFELFNLPRP